SFAVPRRSLPAAARRHSYAFTLQSLADLQMATGAHREAGRVFGESMDLLAEAVALAAASLSEGEQQSTVRGFGLQRLERYLSLSLDPRTEVSAEEAYRHLLTWKGAHFARQR